MDMITDIKKPKNSIWRMLIKDASLPQYTINPQKIQIQKVIKKGYTKKTIQRKTRKL
jgi:hypothetical protein